ncbi:MAG: hypothetical protein QXP82_03075 [Candidatus Aenigmatarchaeota archaeon]
MILKAVIERIIKKSEAKQLIESGLRKKNQSCYEIMKTSGVILNLRCSSNQSEMEGISIGYLRTILFRIHNTCEGYG